MCTVNKHSSITVKRLRMDHPEEMPFKGGIVALCPYHGHLPYFRRLTILYVQSANVPIQRSTAYRPLVLLAIVHAHLEWWDVRTPGAILNVFDFLDYTYFKISLILNFSRLLVSFASLAEIIYYIPPPLTVHFPMSHSVKYQPIITHLILHATH